MGASLTSALALCLDDVVNWNTYAGTASLITVIAATNEPWAVDAGFLRPGRFDKKLFVGPLDEQGRCMLLREHLEMYRFTQSGSGKGDVLQELSARMSGLYTGADIALFAQNVKLAHFKSNSALVETAIMAHDGAISGACVDMDVRDLWEELSVFTPSVSQRDINGYIKWGKS